MKLTAGQKIWLVFFVCTLASAYLVANWRNEASLSTLSEKLEREEELLQSTQKLLNNCEQNESKSNDHYDANYQVCANGEQVLQRTTSNINTLTEDQNRLPSEWWRNFLLTVLGLNAIGFVAYKSRQLLFAAKSV